MTSELPAATDPDVLVRVVLTGYPLAIGLKANEHYEGVFRELALLSAATPDDDESLAARVIALVDDLGLSRARNNELDAERMAALALGHVQRDLELRVPRSVIAPSQQLDRLLDEVDELCRSGSVLALGPDDDVVAFRRWYLSELVTQVRGGPATAWSEVTP